MPHSCHTSKILKEVLAKKVFEELEAELPLLADCLQEESGFLARPIHIRVRVQDGGAMQEASSTGAPPAVFLAHLHILGNRWSRQDRRKQHKSPQEQNAWIEKSEAFLQPRLAKPTGAKLTQNNHQKCYSSMSKLSVAKASDQSCSGVCVQFQAASLG